MAPHFCFLLMVYSLPHTFAQILLRQPIKTINMPMEDGDNWNQDQCEHVGNSRCPLIPFVISCCHLPGGRQSIRYDSTEGYE